MADRVLIITRADSTVGYEHLLRSTTLSRHLRAELGADAQIVLLGDENSLGYIRRQKEQALFFPSWELRWAVRHKLLAELLQRRYPFYKPHVVVFETYAFADTYWGRGLFRQLFPLSIFFGLDIYPHRSQQQRPERKTYQPVALDFTVNSQLAPFGSDVGELDGALLYYGTDYLILPLELLATPPWRPPQRGNDAIPVFLGGGASTAAHRVLSVLSNPRFENRRFRFFSNHPKLAQKFARGGVSVERLPRGVEFYRAFRSAPFGIVSCGPRLYDLAYLGMPLIMVPLGAHEVSTAQKAANAGFGLTVLPRERDLEEQLEQAMLRLDAPEFALDQSERGRRLIDGQGIHRVTAIVERALERVREKLA
jgi:spore coat polysaccharide biosynthesis predicted glycosyltransferase SpsG